LLTQHQLIEATAEGNEGQRLTALHRRGDQAARGQRQCRVDAQLLSGQRRVQQADHHPEAGLAVLLDLLAGGHLALDQGADRKLAKVDLTERLPAGRLQGRQQSRVGGGGDEQGGTGSGGSGAARFQCRLATVVEGQAQGELKALQGFLDADDFGLGAFPGGEQPLHRLQQLQRKVRGCRRRSGRSGCGKGLGALDLCHLLLKYAYNL